MHRLSTSFVLGYHGCFEETAEKLLDGERFKFSKNDYDWLGEGVYFWEANPQRGLDFASEMASRRRARVGDLFAETAKPTVIGAVLDLGFCLDLTTLGAIDMLEKAYVSLEETFRISDQVLPKNSKDHLLRRLDCAVVTRLHSILAVDGNSLDSVRGVFIEGAPIYPNSGFFKKTHTQIAVRNLECIKAVFRVPETQLKRWSADFQT